MPKIPDIIRRFYQSELEFCQRTTSLLRAQTKKNFWGSMISFIVIVTLLAFSFAMSTALPLSLFIDTNSTDLNTLQDQLITVKSELSKTSSQDEFAKWAKLRRQYDSINLELGTMTAEESQKKQMRQQRIKRSLWIARVIVKYTIAYAGRSISIITFAPNTMTPLVEYCTALPYTVSRGSIGVLVWWFCCDRVATRLIHAVE